MNHLWTLDIDTAIEWYELLKKIQEDMKKELTRQETEIVFLKFMEMKNIKSSGGTELNTEELIKEYVSHGKKILSIDKDGMKIIKPKEKE